MILNKVLDGMIYRHRESRERYRYRVLLLLLGLASEKPALLAEQGNLWSAFCSLR